ncbi:MAG TPA: lipase maturation factor family protein [Patescibacteria group bacterium]|nr:lipase maturation factor family protein [Patescibacteria group bacterium]
MEFLPFSMPDATVIWGIFLRGLGLMYFIATAQLFHQVLPLAGSRGISPLKPRLAQISRDYPSWRKWLYFPTIFHLYCSDTFLQAVILTGSVSALLVIIGGPYAAFFLFVSWFIYISLDLVFAFSYPWDCVLLEAGFLGLFLPALHYLPDPAAVTLPHPAVAWLFRLLVFRLIFGFGKLKFWKSNPRDTGYFRAFMANIPLPTYLGWFSYQLPKWCFQAMLAFAFVVEIIVPFFIFSHSELRIVAAVSIITLMIGIQAVSNFGFFNAVTIVICIPLFDIHSSIFDLHLTDLYSSPGNIITSAIAVILLTGGFLNFFFNSWCTSTWLHWPSALFIRSGFLTGILSFYRAIFRFRITHSYGVFPPKSAPPIKLVPVIEGTRDGIHWEAYEYRFMNTHETTPPRFVAPFHPRWDHAIFYESFGVNDSNFMWSVIGSGNPYSFLHASCIEEVLENILQGNPETSKLFRSVPFSPSEPPLRVRVNLYRFQPTSFKERRATGKWWTKRFAETHLPERRLNPGLWQMRRSQPELFHWDAVYWRRRSPRMKAMMNIGATASSAEVFKTASEGLIFDTEYLWNEFLPLFHSREKNWAELPALSELLKARYTFKEIQALEILWNRLAIMLGEKLQPYFLGVKTPKLEIKKYFHFGLFIHHIIGKGREAFEFALENPAEASVFLKDFSLEKAFFHTAIFWFDMLVYQARKIRWGQRSQPAEPPSEVIPGFADLLPFLGQQFTEIGEENWPAIHKDERNGEWKVYEVNEQGKVWSGSVEKV